MSAEANTRMVDLIRVATRNVMAAVNETGFEDRITLTAALLGCVVAAAKSCKLPLEELQLQMTEMYASPKVGCPPPGEELS